MKKEDILNIIAANKNNFRMQFGVTKVGLFGSYARDEADEQSDIDIVVELEKPDLFYLIGIKQILEESTGAKVDVVRLRKRMNEVLRKKILRDVIYV